MFDWFQLRGARIVPEWMGLAVAACLLAPLNGPSSGQEYLVDAWEVEDGLPQNTIQTMVQTQDGYIWLGTFDGLARFDGARFTTFNTSNTESLRSSHVRCLYEDRTGRLWIGTEGGGVSVYSKGEFQRAPHHPEGGDYLHIRAIGETADELLVVCTSMGLFSIGDGGWKALTVPNGHLTPRPELGKFAQDETGLWFKNGPHLYEIIDGQLIERREFEDIIDTITVDANGAVLCGLNNGDVIELTTNELPRRISFDRVVWHDIHRAKNGDLWLTSQKGLVRVRGEDRLRITTDHGLLVDDVLNFLEDHEGNLWLGSNGGGLQRIREKIARVHSTDNGLLSDDTASVTEDDSGRIWVGSFKGGVSILEDGRWLPLEMPHTGFWETNIVSTLQTRAGKIWIGGYNFPHFVWDNGRFEPCLAEAVSIRALFEDQMGALWAGSHSDGLFKTHNGRTERYGSPEGLSRGHITAIAEDREGAIWVGTNDGLNMLIGGAITTFGREHGLPVESIYSLLVDQEGALWIGSGGSGLIRYSDGEFRNLTTEHGLPSDVAGQLLEDDLGYLWIGSPAGLFRASIADLHAAMDGHIDFVPGKTFGKAEGLLNSECTGGFQPACMRSSNGHLWFCTIGGAVEVDPSQIEVNAVPPPVHIEEIVLDDDVTIPILGKDNIDIVVPPGTARLDIRYTGLSFIAPNRVRFRHILEGYDQDWTRSRLERVARYTKVPPGQYSFHVMAANNDGLWNQQAAVINLTVQPYFWQTVWFQTLGAVAAAAIVAGLVWIRFRHLQNIQSLRLRIAQDLHDETGSDLGSVQLLVRRAIKRLRRNENPLQEMMEIQRINMATADSLRDAVWIIDPKFDTLGQMLKAMENVAARLLEGVRYEVRWNVSGPDRPLPLDFRTQFFLLFKETIHNIEKHARASEATITLDEKQSEFHLRVSDNGAGFDPSEARSGHGLEGLKSRAGRLSGELRIESQPGRGTTIMFKVKTP